MCCWMFVSVKFGKLWVFSTNDGIWQPTSKKSEKIMGYSSTHYHIYFFQHHKLENTCLNEALKFPMWHFAKINSWDLNGKMIGDSLLVHRLSSIWIRANLIRVLKNKFAISSLGQGVRIWNLALKFSFILVNIWCDFQQNRRGGQNNSFTKKYPFKIFRKNLK